MSATDPAYHIPRRSLAGEEAMWVKMWDPPKDSPDTPDWVAPTNPVPAFVAATVPGADMTTPNTVQVDIMHGRDLVMHDGKEMAFFVIGNPDVPAASGGIFPGPTIRVPRGVIFHAETHAHGQPPHTIHWHGIEPTPMNDGVGHCSMELGDYIYQFQPNFIGTYFYHCHRNTVQHFEFGLYGMLLVEPPDAFNTGPGLNPGGYPRRTAANLAKFRQFPGFNSNPVESMDPQAMTVPYDVEALWVLDDRDSVWADLAEHARAFYPAHNLRPGVDDTFFHGFFHDFNPDYFFATGAPFVPPIVPDGTGLCAENIVVPREFNSGVAGMQVSINAQVNQTILVRALCAAYGKIRIKFPVDVVIIAFDGRALGVPPFTRYNNAFLLKAGTAYELSTARRFDALIRSTKPVNSVATVEFLSARGDRLQFTGHIPVKIS